MPGAIHLEWTNFISRDSHHTIKKADELNEILRTAGVTPEKEIVTNRQGGIRAAHGAFVLALLGYQNVRNYDGSMGEWANREGTPLTLE